jgi:hypothetical protein
MNTIKYLIFSAFLLALIQGCSKEDNGNAPEFTLKNSDALDDLDYRLYSLVLGEMFTEPKNLVVIQDVHGGGPVTNHEFLQNLNHNYPEIDTTIFYDPVLLKDSVYYLENKFSVPGKKINLVSSGEIDYYFSNKEDVNAGWVEFYFKYPDSGGTISFSRIGYNSGKTQAIIFLGNIYASLGGEGHMIFLKLENNGWKILQAMRTWIS